MSAPFEQLLWLSMANAAIAFTVTEAKIFERLREWIKGKSAFCGELFSCGYCLGHWSAFLLVAVYQPRLFERWWPLDYFLTALVIAWLSGFQWALLCWLMEKAGK
ncbi:MAG: DUF1360 domain-containing protein [Candidatus Competibacteraceae bacterium]